MLGTGDDVERIGCMDLVVCNTLNSQRVNRRYIIHGKGASSEEANARKEMSSSQQPRNENLGTGFLNRRKATVWTLPVA